MEAETRAELSRSVPCPTCRAERGAACTGERGQALKSVHRARRDALKKRAEGEYEGWLKVIGGKE